MTIQVGSVGYIIRVTVRDNDTRNPLDISTATVKRLNITYPSGKAKSVDMDFDTTGIDGGIQYTTASGDISESGNYILSVYIEMPTRSGMTSNGTMLVKQ